MGKIIDPSIEEQRSSLKQRIDDLENYKRRAAAQRQRASLSTRRKFNARSPPNRLPVELLSQIFVCHSTALMRPLGASQNRSGLERITIAHVCHWWRKIALDLGELWSNILFVSPGIADFMLYWSKGVPLTMTFDNSDHRWATPFFLIVATNLPRIRSLEVSNIGNNSRDRELVSLLGFSTPVLERLVLRIRETGSPNPVQAFRLPDRFLQGSPSHLKHLEITGFELPDLEVLPPTLIHLQLGSEYLSTGMRHSLESILKTLRRLPCLQTLILNHCASDGSRSTFSGTVIESSSLLNFTIRDSTITVERILQHIRIPRAAVHLLLQDPLNNTEDVRRFLSALMRSRGIRTPLALGELSVSETCSPTKSLLLNFSFIPRAAELGPSPADICVGLPRPIRHSLMQLVSLFGERCVDIRSLGSLRMQDRKCKFSRREWIVLGRLPSLQSVAFNHGAEAIDFCEALKVDAGPAKQDHASFGSLASISLEGVNLKRDSYVCYSLVAALKSRSNFHRLEKLEVTPSDNDFSESDVEFLQEAVLGMEVV